MPKHTGNSQNQFTSIGASLDRQLQANETLLAKTMDQDQLEDLAMASEQISQQMRDLANLRHAYALSHLDPTVAERALTDAASNIKSFATNLKTVVKVLDSVASVARIFTNLFAIFV